MDEASASKQIDVGKSCFIVLCKRACHANHPGKVSFCVGPAVVVSLEPAGVRRVLFTSDPVSVNGLRSHRFTDMKTSSNEFGQPVGFPLPVWTPPPKPPRESMTGTLCRLEPLDPDRHAAALFAANTADGGAQNWTYLAYGPFQSLADYRSWMETNCLGEDPLFFAIIDLADEQPARVASYLRIAPESGSIEVGHIHYAPRLQRRPAATEAMYLMMKQAFALGYRRYEWKCDALNAPSRAAAQRLGLSFEGVFREATVYKR